MQLNRTSIDKPIRTQQFQVHIGENWKTNKIFDKYIKFKTWFPLSNLPNISGFSSKKFMSGRISDFWMVMPCEMLFNWFKTLKLKKKTIIIISGKQTSWWSIRMVIEILFAAVFLPWEEGASRRLMSWKMRIVDLCPTLSVSLRDLYIPEPFPWELFSIGLDRTHCIDIVHRCRQFPEGVQKMALVVAKTVRTYGTANLGHTFFK